MEKHRHPRKCSESPLKVRETRRWVGAMRVHSQQCHHVIPPVANEWIEITDRGPLGQLVPFLAQESEAKFK